MFRRAVIVAVLGAATFVASGPARAIESDRLKYGEVIAAQQALLDAPPGSGKREGATIGAIVGFALMDNGERWIGAALGGVVGGAVGNGAQKKKGWLLGVRLDNGEEIGVEIIGLKDHFAPGDKVRLFTLEDGRVHVRKR